MTAAKEWRMCGKKRNYKTESEAKEWMERTPNNNLRSPLHVYKCHLCGNWHIGHINIGRIKFQRKQKERQRRVANVDL